MIMLLPDSLSLLHTHHVVHSFPFRKCTQHVSDINIILIDSEWLRLRSTCCGKFNFNHISLEQVKKSPADPCRMTTSRVFELQCERLYFREPFFFGCIQVIHSCVSQSFSTSLHFMLIYCTYSSY